MQAKCRVIRASSTPYLRLPRPKRRSGNVRRFVKEAAAYLPRLPSAKLCRLLLAAVDSYIRSLLTGLINAPEASARSKSIVEKKIASLQEQGLQVNEVSQALHAWLGALDLESQKSLHCHYWTRIVRALLVNLTIGKSVAALRELHRSRDWQYRALVFSLSYDREQLYLRSEPAGREDAIRRFARRSQGAGREIRLHGSAVSINRLQASFAIYRRADRSARRWSIASSVKRGALPNAS